MPKGVCGIYAGAKSILSDPIGAAHSGIALAAVTTSTTRSLTTTCSTVAPTEIAFCPPIYPVRSFKFDPN